MARIEINRGGIAHFALDVTGEWARTQTPHLLVLTDYDSNDRLIAVTFAGPLARVAINEGVPAALAKAVTPEILDQITGPGATVDRDELDHIADAVNHSLDLVAA